MRTTLFMIWLMACGGTSAAPVPSPEPAPPPATAPAPAPVTEAAPVATDTAPADLEAGALTYQTYCVACHQADGSGLNGMLAANFKEEGRLDKTDAELLTSIRDGKTGKVGTMPPWKTSLSDQDMVNVLGHVRKTYGQ